MAITLYELREVSHHRLLLTTPDLKRAYELLSALRTEVGQYEIIDQDGRSLTEDELQKLLDEQPS